jgi:ankyrin repeat protein
MSYFKQLIVIIILFFGTQLIAQDNVFLKRDYWDSNPTFENIDTKIKEGHDIAQANSNNFDAVVYAILQNAPNETLIYIQSKPGNDVNKLTHDGRTYIFWAAYKGNVEFMEYLLNKGAKTDITDDKGNTILNFAAGSGQQNTKVYDLCLTHGANLKKDVTPNGANALLLAAPFDTDFKLTEYFISKGLDLKSVDAEGNNIFNYVAKTGNISMLKQLMEKGIKGTDNAFIFATYGTRNNSNGLEFYQFIESVGLNPNTMNKEEISPLHIVASRSQDLEIINYFITNGNNVNQTDKDGNTPFLNASNRNNLEVVSFLFKDVNNINATNKKVESALSMAVSNNSSDVVEFLINNNADISVVDANGNNLTYYLLESFNSKKLEDFEKKIALLKAHGLDVASIQKNGNTLYHLAVEKNNLELVKWVSNYKIVINAKNAEGNTALHLAALNAKNTDILKYLISHGANTDEVTEFEETAYNLASENEILKTNNISIDFLK